MKEKVSLHASLIHKRVEKVGGKTIWKVVDLTD